MEREKAIKVGVAGAIGLVAVIILAMSLFGGGGPTKPADETEVIDEAVPEVPTGGGRSLPGVGDD